MSIPPGDPNFGGQQQWGQQPGQQPQPQWGPPPGQFAQNPYLPTPKKSRTPLIAALVALVLVIAGGAIAAIVLLTDSDDEQAGGVELQGKGYVYTLPEGWTDVTDEVKESNPLPSIDTVSAAGKVLAMAPGNFIVETMSVPEGTTPEEIRSQWEQTVTGALNGLAPLPTDNVEFDGAEAIGMRFEHDQNPAGVPLVQHAYLFVEGEIGYAVSLTMKASDEDDLFEDFTDLRESWNFE